MENKLISVIVPVYNGADTLRACISSIEAQTYKNIQIIIVNDGSEDDSLAAAHAAASEYDNITVADISHGGVSAARNAGIEQARGDFITFTDCDDTIDRDMFKVLADACDEDTQLSVVGIERISRGERSFERYSDEDTVYISNAARLYMKSTYFNSCSNKLYRRAIIADNGIRFRKGVRIGEDFLFNAAYARYVTRAAVISRPLYTYEMSGTTVRPSADTGRFRAIEQMHDAIIPLAYGDSELLSVIRRRIYDEYVLAFRIYCMSDAPFGEMVRNVRDVMGSEQYADAQTHHDNVGGAYGAALKLGALAVCVYFRISKMKNRGKD